MKAISNISIIFVVILCINCKGVEDIFEESTYDIASAETDSSAITSELEQTDSADQTSFGVVLDSNLFGVPGCIIPLPESKLGVFEFPLIIVWEGDWISSGPWATPTILIEESTSLTLDYKLPMNVLETIMSPAKFEVESFPPTTSTGKENLVISLYKDANLSIILRDHNSKELKTIHSGLLAAGRHTFEVDLSWFDNGYYFVCLESGSDKKILSIRRENVVL